jgi:hypothetical protein
VAVADGSLTENFNKTGVRLWTGCSRDQHRAPRRRYQVDATDHIGDGAALAHDAVLVKVVASHRRRERSASGVFHNCQEASHRVSIPQSTDPLEQRANAIAFLRLTLSVETGHHISHATDPLYPNVFTPGANWVSLGRGKSLRPSDN